MITKIICGYFVYMLPIRRFSGQSKIVRGEARRAMLLSAALGACRPLSALPHRCRKPPSLRDNEGRKSLAVSVGSVRESISPEMAHQLRSRVGREHSRETRQVSGRWSHSAGSGLMKFASLRPVAPVKGCFGTGIRLHPSARAGTATGEPSQWGSLEARLSVSSGARIQAATAARQE